MTLHAKTKEIPYADYQEYTKNQICPCCVVALGEIRSGFFCLNCSKLGCWASYSQFHADRNKNVLIFVHCREEI